MVCPTAVHASYQALTGCVTFSQRAFDAFCRAWRCVASAQRSRRCDLFVSSGRHVCSASEAYLHAPINAGSNYQAQNAAMTKAAMSAAAYIRVSSKTNSKEGKHSLERQRKAIQQFVAKRRLKLGKSAVFQDLGVSGTIPVQDRCGFAKMLAYVAQNKVDKILFEDATRLARCVVVQELALQLPKDMDAIGISCASPEQFVENTLLLPSWCASSWGQWLSSSALIW